MFEIISGSLTGLGLFLLGMKYMTNGLNRLTTNRIRYIISNMKIHPIIGLFIGIIATSLMQSSSGTTILLVGLVEAGILSLYQVVPMIMGANIGTTLTAQIIALNIGQYGFITFITGILMNFSFKNSKIKFIGEVFIGFSLIFIGIDWLSRSMMPMKDIMGFKLILEELGKKPLLGILMGFSTTSIIQSSSTGIAILQSLASGGSLSTAAAIPILLGQNIGTCVTTLLSSIQLSKTGKRTALIHLLFNIGGVLIFLPFIHILVKISCWISPFNPSRQIANAHTIFNVSSAIIFLPIYHVFVRIACFLIRD